MMSVQVDAYTSEGLARGTLAWPGSLRDVLETGRLPLDGAAWQGLRASMPESIRSMSIPSDDVLVAVGDEDPGLAIHATWHHVRLESGPYTVEGELPTQPGFDPGRALTRPSGEFLELRDVRVTLRGRPDGGIATGGHALVNRYAVERIQADLMLGFFFPGATVDPASPGDAVSARPEQP
jgi:hypothetical protein